MYRPAYLFLIWAPRLLNIFLAIFFGLFALEISTSEAFSGELVLSLLIYLLPTLIVLLLLVLAWRWEWLGALGFTIMGVAIGIFFMGGENWVYTLILIVLIFLIALLYLTAWVTRRQSAKLEAPKL